MRRLVLASVTLLCAMALVRAAPQTASAPATPAPGAAQAGTGGGIRGHVDVPDDRALLPRPSITDVSGPRARMASRRHVVVYLDAVPRGAFDELPPARARMDQRGEQFVPHILAITTGTTVDFPNHDTTFHNVFSLSRVRTFDLGRFPPGRTGSVRFSRPGIVPVFCDIHSHMSAYILVFSHPFFAVTDDDGDYAIDGIPAGSYTLDVWSELGTAAPRRVTVTDGGTASVDFRVSREP
jgi:plastocyanin